MPSPPTSWASRLARCESNWLPRLKLKSPLPAVSECGHAQRRHWDRRSYSSVYSERVLKAGAFASSNTQSSPCAVYCCELELLEWSCILAVRLKVCVGRPVHEEAAFTRRRHLRSFCIVFRTLPGYSPKSLTHQRRPKGCANPLATIQRFLLNQLYPSLPLEMGVAIPSFLSHC